MLVSSTWYPPELPLPNVQTCTLSLIVKLYPHKLFAPRTDDEDRSTHIFFVCVLSLFLVERFDHVVHISSWNGTLTNSRAIDPPLALRLNLTLPLQPRIVVKSGVYRTTSVCSAVQWGRGGGGGRGGVLPWSARLGRASRQCPQRSASRHSS